MAENGVYKLLEQKMYENKLNDQIAFSFHYI